MKEQEDLKTIYDNAKGWRKFIFFNIYAIAMCLMFFAISSLVDIVFAFIDNKAIDINYSHYIINGLCFGYIFSYIILKTKLLTKKLK